VDARRLTCLEDDDTAAPTVAEITAYLVAGDDVVGDLQALPASVDAAAVVAVTDVVLDPVVADHYRPTDHRDPAAALRRVGADDVADDGRVGVLGGDAAAATVGIRARGVAGAVALDDVTADDRGAAVSVHATAGAAPRQVFGGAGSAGDGEAVDGAASGLEQGDHRVVAGPVEDRAAGPGGEVAGYAGAVGGRGTAGVTAEEIDGAAGNPHVLSVGSGGHQDRVTVRCRIHRGLYRAVGLHRRTVLGAGVVVVVDVQRRAV